MKKTLRTYIVGILISSLCGLTLWSCDPWELPTRKERRNCAKPAGTLNAQMQQLKVDFSISNNSGTIDQVVWDFGNGNTTTTTGLTTTYTYPASGTYTVKATLTNSCRVETIIQKDITVSNAVLPTVSIQAATNVSTSSATIGMTIVSTGNATINQYGVCYSSTNQVPDKDKDKMVPGTGSGTVGTSIPFSLTGLEPNTTYYVRSYAVNSAGIKYSETVQIIKTGSNPSVSSGGSPTVGSTTATVGFILNDAGNPAAIQYGVLYSSSNSTPSMDNSGPGVTVNNPNVGASTPVNLTDLKPNTTYYYRSYAKLPSGEIVLGPVNTFTTQADAVANGLIAYLPFTDRSLQDFSGSSNNANGINNPSFTTDRKGVANAAILFNGQSNYIYLSDNNSLRPDALSVSVWIKPITVNRKMQIYNKSNFTDSKNEMYSSTIKPNENGPGITILTDIKQNSGCQPVTGWQSFPLTSAIQLNTWHHVVFTYTGRSARMYFDGALLYVTDALPASTIDKCPGGDLRFGAQIADFPQYFDGAMDEIRIYNRALSASEVQTLYNQ